MREFQAMKVWKLSPSISLNMSHFHIRVSFTHMPRLVLQARMLTVVFSFSLSF